MKDTVNGGQLDNDSVVVEVSKSKDEMTAVGTAIHADSMAA